MSKRDRSQENEQRRIRRQEDPEYRERQLKHFRRWFLTNYEKTREKAWSKQGINITWDTYEKLFIAQQGACALCLRSGLTNELVPDHEHGTDWVRGLLCHRCNKRLGLCGDTLPAIRALHKRHVEYLKNSRARRKEYLLKHNQPANDNEPDDDED